MAILARIAGAVTIDGTPAARKVLVISDSASPTVLASAVSDASGNFEIEYSGWAGAVIALAHDDYGVKFSAANPLIIGNIVHPTVPSGYVYSVTVGGVSGESEPVWPTSGSIQTGSATLVARSYYRPIASGPVQADILDNSPLVGDVYFRNVVALLHFNAANGSTVFADLRGANWTRTGSVVISTGKSKFGGSSAKFTAGSITAVRDDFQLTRNSLMTIEFWINFDSVSYVPHVMVLGTSESHRITIFVYLGQLVFWSKTATGNHGIRIYGPNVTVGVFYHVALTKIADVWELFVNGVSYGTSNTTIYPTGVASQIALGTMPYGSASVDYLNGYIDDFRVTTWINRYEGGCTVPVAQFPDQGLS